MGKTAVGKLVLYLGAIVVFLGLGAGACLYFEARTNFQKAVVKTEEEILTDQLKRIRASIKQYSREKEIPPQSLDELVRSGYLPEMPTDPITQKQEWQVEIGDYELPSGKRARGVVNVHSLSNRKSSSGTLYSQW